MGCSCFFMITGVLLLDRQVTYKNIINKYVKRIVLAILIFGIPFAILKIVGESKNISIDLVKKTIFAILENDSFAHLWYLYALIGIYLVLPLLHSFTELGEETQKGILVSLFILAFVVPTINSVAGIRIAFNIPFSYPIFYVLLGNYISKKININRNTKIVALIAIAIAVVIIISANILEIHPKEISAYYSPVIVILAISIFILFMGISKECSDKVWKLDRLCFSIYLIHPLFIQFVYRFAKLTPVRFGAYYIVIIGFFVFYLVCSVISAIVMNMIGPLKKNVL
ncbi:MAG: acyltransferase [Lachnospiraceae bacterium]|nr:acyltransferase [Lachnospiraceae bacterium]